jgi:hypothetical protein
MGRHLATDVFSLKDILRNLDGKTELTPDEIAHHTLLCQLIASKEELQAMHQTLAHQQAIIDAQKLRHHQSHPPFVLVSSTSPQREDHDQAQESADTSLPHQSEQKRAQAPAPASLFPLFRPKSLSATAATSPQSTVKAVKGTSALLKHIVSPRAPLLLQAEASSTKRVGFNVQTGQLPASQPLLDTHLTSMAPAAASVQSLNAIDAATIRELKRRMSARSYPDGKVKPLSKIATLKAQEKADLKNYGSERCVEERLSEDEHEDVCREAGAKLAHQALFRPHSTRLRNKHGYVPNAFIAEDDSSTSRDSSPQSLDRDDDTSSDYKPSSQSQSHSPSQQGNTPHPPQIEDILCAHELAEFRQFQALQRTRGSSEPRSDLVDHHGRSLDVVPQFHFNNAVPPQHGEWRDIGYLMNTFLDEHSKYVQRCNGARHLSIWECYTRTSRQQIVKHLQPKNATFTEAHLSSMTDEALLEVLQNNLGVTYSLEVEAALTSISLQGSALDATNWVNLNTAWTQVLERVTESGRVAPRRLAEIFRENIPDPFIKNWLVSNKHSTWEAAYNAVIAGLHDAKWLLCYARDQSTRAQQQQQQQQQRKQHSFNSGAPIHTANSVPLLSPMASANRPKQPQAQSGGAIVFDPLKYRNKRGQLNFNPNLKPEINGNPKNVPCTRCGDTHRFASDLCTSIVGADKQSLEPLAPEEIKRRQKKRWDEGYFFAKPLQEFKSPSAQDAAAGAQAAVSRVGGNNK